MLESEAVPRAGRGSWRPAFRKAGQVIALDASFDVVAMLRRSSLLLLVGVLGPGLLAGLSDDDAPGITTYSILGADYGYELLWVLGLATLALILFHELGARMGVVTGQGLDGSHARAVRSPPGSTRSSRAARRKHRHDLRRVRRGGGEPRSRGCDPLRLRSRGRSRDLGTRPAWVVPSSGARLPAHVDPPCDVYRRGVRDGAGLGSRGPRPARAERARDARRSPRHHRDRRNDLGALGTRVHPVVRGRQEALRGRPAIREDRRRHRCGDDGRYRILRRRHVRCNAPSTGNLHQGRGGRGQRPRTARRPIRLRPLRRRATRGLDPRGFDPAARNGLLGQRSVRPGGRLDARSEKPRSSTEHLRSSSSPPVRSCSSRGRRLSRSSISHRR